MTVIGNDRKIGCWRRIAAKGGGYAAKRRRSSVDWKKHAAN